MPKPTQDLKFRMETKILQNQNQKTTKSHQDVFPATPAFGTALCIKLVCPTIKKHNKKLLIHAILSPAAARHRSTQLWRELKVTAHTEPSEVDKAKQMLCAINPTLSTHYRCSNSFTFSLISVVNSHLPLTDKKGTPVHVCNKLNPRTHGTRYLLLHQGDSLVKRSGEVQEQSVCCWPEP